MSSLLTISELAPRAEGVARLLNGKVIFIPYSAVGDEVEITITQEKKGYARGEITKLISAGPTRRKPPCALAESGACGGCPMMHVTEAEQHRAKTNWVAQALRRLNKPLLPLLTPNDPLAYRIRARFVCHNQVLGFQAARSNDVTQIHHCPVLVPKLDEVMCNIAKLIHHAIGEKGELSGIIGISAQVHLSIKPGLQANISELKKRLQQQFDTHVFVGVTMGNWQLGVESVNIGTLESPLMAGASSFAQASIAGQQLLPKIVADFLGEPPSAQSKWPVILELFAGAGNLTRTLLSRTSSLIAIEENPAACQQLKQLQSHHSHLSVMQMTVENALSRIPANHINNGAIILDPPRQGCIESIPLIAKQRPLKIIYVSCDPMTLARDVEKLLLLGYAVDSIQPIELFPQTAHIETVVCLSRQ